MNNDEPALAALPSGEQLGVRVEVTGDRLHIAYAKLPRERAETILALLANDDPDELLS